MEYKISKEKQKELLGLPYERKVGVTQARILEFMIKTNYRGCVSYSGGLDSIVLLHLCRKLFPDMRAFTAGTINLRSVKDIIDKEERIEVAKPLMTFAEVIEKHGFCFPNKEVAGAIEGYRRGVPWCLKAMKGLNGQGQPNNFRKKWSKYLPLADNHNIKISDKCCEIMKEKPLHLKQRQEKLFPFIGLRAEESPRRRKAWMMTGCNDFKGSKTKSIPMAFWSHQDVLRYIKENGLNYPTCYGEIINDNGRWYNTGVRGTGCVCCVGMRNYKNKKNYFELLKESEPKLYKYVVYDLGMHKLFDFMKIRY